MKKTFCNFVVGYLFYHHHATYENSEREGWIMTLLYFCLPSFDDVYDVLDELTAPSTFIGDY